MPNRCGHTSQSIDFNKKTLNGFTGSKKYIKYPLNQSNQRLKSYSYNLKNVINMCINVPEAV